MNKKYLKWVAVAFVAWFLITNPTQAAATVNNALDGLGDAAQSLSQFMTGLDL